MLEGLDNINWSSLSHARGAATDMPSLIRALLSDDPEEVEKTFDKLYDNLFHQQTAYQATAYAVPFLLELLESDELEDKAGLLCLLANLAMDSSYCEHIRQSSFPHAEINKLVEWGETAHQAVRQGIPVYLKFLHDDHEKRMMAARVLQNFPEDAVMGAGKLRSAIERETDSEVKVELIASLGHLILSCKDFPAEQRREYAAFLEAIFLKALDEELKLAAAIALAKVAQADAPREVEDVLINGLAVLDQESTWKKSIILPAVHELGDERAKSVLLRVLQVASEEEVIHEISVIMLKMVFGKEPMKEYSSKAHSWGNGFCKIEYSGGWMAKEVPPRETITGDQYQIIEALMNCDVFWQVDTNLLVVFGLPNDRDALRDFLQKG